MTNEYNYLRTVSFILYSRELVKIPKARRRKRHLKSERQFIALIPSRSIFQMQAKYFGGVEFFRDLP